MLRNEFSGSQDSSLAGERNESPGAGAVVGAASGSCTEAWRGWGDPVTAPSSPSDLLLRLPRAEPAGSWGFPDHVLQKVGGNLLGAAEMETHRMENIIGHQK